MTSYKNILKQIANMEQRLCIDDPCEILDDILKIAKRPLEKDKEKNRINCKRYRERHRAEYNFRHKILQRKYNKRKKEAK